MKAKTKWLPFWCQCKDCLETFSIDGAVNDGHIVKLESHPRVGRNNGTYYHRCGGNGHIKGKLVLYPALKFWRS